MVNLASYAQVTWIAGDGNWSVGSNWSTGSVPGISDDVIIDVADDDIKVNIITGNYKIKSLYIGTDDTLVISMDQKLIVENSDNNGIEVEGGRLIVEGELDVKNANSIGITVQGGVDDGVLNNLGDINVEGSNGSGIHCAGVFSNVGNITCTSNGGDGIELSGFVWPLYGTITSSFNGVGIDIRPSSFVWNFGILNSVENNLGMKIWGELLNDTTGSIIFENSVNFGLDVFGGTADNIGYMFIDGASVTGLSVRGGGTFNNSKEFIIQNCLIGIQTKSSSAEANRISNSGNMEIKNCLTGLTLGEYLGISSVDSLVNYETIRISDCTNDGINIFGNSYFGNRDSLIINGCGKIGIVLRNPISVLENSGSLFISDCGVYGVTQTTFSLFDCSFQSEMEISNCNSGWKLELGSDLILALGASVKTNNITGPVIFDIKGGEVIVPLGAEFEMDGN